MTTPARRRPRQPRERWAHERNTGSTGERREDWAPSPRPADVLVIFGITGDLAKVMTFHSLYRLEQRGLLDCPIVGVAFDDWTLEQLVQRARDSIVGTGEKLDEDVFTRFAKPALVPPRRLHGRRDLRRGRGGDRGRDDSGLLPRGPAVPLRHRRRRTGEGGRDGERESGRREAVRARHGVCEGARRGAAPVHRRVAAPSHRPLPREDGPRGDPLHPVRRTRCSSRSGTGTTSSPSRSRWPRTSASRTAATSTTRSALFATSSSTTSCRWSG